MKAEPIQNAGIYEILNTFNGKRYIGSSSNLKNRLNSHRRLLTNENHHNVHLQRAWNLNGEKAFKFNILLYCSSDNLLMYEQILLDSIYQHEYNIAIIAGAPMAGRTSSPETRLKLSIAGTGRKPTIETREKLVKWQIGRKFTEEHKAKISLSMSGKKCPPRSAEHLRNLSIANTGKTLSIEHRNKIRAYRLGKKASTETREKMSSASKGKPKSPEHRERLATANRNRALLRLN